MKRNHEKPIWVERFISRREMLSFMGATAVTLLMGCERGKFGSKGLASLFSQKRIVTTMPPCIVRPEQTEGPAIQRIFIDTIGTTPVYKCPNLG